MEQFSNPNFFKPWVYLCGHRSLLIRGQYAAPGKRNVDVMFLGVYYMELPGEGWTGLTLEEPTPDERKYVQERIGQEWPVSKGLHVLVSEAGRRYYVYSAYLRIEENDLDFHEHNLGA